jgi:hypothetical protein
MKTNALELLIAAKDQEISRLIVEKDRLENKLLALLDPKAFETYKFYSKEKTEGRVRRPMTVDEKTGVLREKTESEMTAEFKALQELGVC